MGVVTRSTPPSPPASQGGHEDFPLLRRGLFIVGDTSVADPAFNPCEAGRPVPPLRSRGGRGGETSALLREILVNEDGQSTLEYALIAGSLALGLIVSIKLLGGAFGLSFGHHSKALMRAR